MKILWTAIMLSVFYMMLNWAYNPQEYKDCVKKNGKEACFEYKTF